MARAKATGIIQRLPVELQLDIVESLDYQSAIMLSQVNRYFRKIVKPRKMSSRKEKKAFVKEAQDFEQHNVNTEFDVNNDQFVVRTIKAGYACYCCCKVKPMDAFSTNMILKCPKLGQQTWRGKLDKRCCIDCSIKMSFFRHGMSIKLLLKTSTLMRYHCHKFSVINVRIIESCIMRYCSAHKKLHSEAEWQKSPKCRQAVKPSKKALRRARTKPSVYRVFKSPTRRCGICNRNSDDGEFLGYCGLGSLYCPQCRIWVCPWCNIGNSQEPQAFCMGEGRVAHALQTAGKVEKVMKEWKRADRYKPRDIFEGAEEILLSSLSI